MPEGLILVVSLVLIALSWLAGWRYGLRQRQHLPLQQPSQKMPGFSPPLNEEPDEAIDSFIRSLEVNPQTLETHLAFGNLLRRRGEVERAIKVHQNLVSRPNLSSYQLSQVQLELARDFLGAGLLDRSERLLLELVNGPDKIRQPSLRHLVEIYRDEQEWEKAIRAAEKLGRRRFGLGQNNMAVEQGHFCCELAVQAMAQQDDQEARRLLRMALRFDKNSVRANLLWGRLEMGAGDQRTALAYLLGIPAQDSAWLPEIIPLVCRCYHQLGERSQLRRQLERWLREHPGTQVLLALVDELKAREGDAVACRFLGDYLQKKPSLKGFYRLLELVNLSDSSASLNSLAREDSLALKNHIGYLDQQAPAYRCRDCGFSGRQLHWLCPQCKHWGSVKPSHG